jgi:hypothetical protein
MNHDDKASLQNQLPESLHSATCRARLNPPIAPNPQGLIKTALEQGAIPGYVRRKVFQHVHELKTNAGTHVYFLILRSSELFELPQIVSRDDFLRQARSSGFMPRLNG